LQQVGGGQVIAVRYQKGLVRGVGMGHAEPDEIQQIAERNQASPVVQPAQRQRKSAGYGAQQPAKVARAAGPYTSGGRMITYCMPWG